MRLEIKRWLIMRPCRHEVLRVLGPELFHLLSVHGHILLLEIASMRCRMPRWGMVARVSPMAKAGAMRDRVAGCSWPRVDLPVGMSMRLPPLIVEPRPQPILLLVPMKKLVKRPLLRLSERRGLERLPRLIRRQSLREM